MTLAGQLCLLHNICEMSNDAIPESWLNAEVDMDQPPTAATPEGTTHTQVMQQLFEIH